MSLEVAVEAAVPVRMLAVLVVEAVAVQ